MRIEPTNKQSELTAALSKSADRIQEIKKRMDEKSLTLEDIGKDEPQLEELLKQVKSLPEDGDYDVQFARSEYSKDFVINVVNSKTNEIVRQIPPEELLKMGVRLDEVRGQLFRTEA